MSKNEKTIPCRLFGRTKVRAALNEKQKRFVAAYLGAGNTAGNATASAIEAGYKAKNANQTSYMLMQHPLIKAAIKEGQDKRREMEEMSINSQELMLNKIIRAAEAKLSEAGVKDMLIALDQKAKRQGLYAPEKREITGADGNPLFVRKEVLTQEEELAELDRIRAAMLENVVNVAAIKGDNNKNEKDN